MQSHLKIKNERVKYKQKKIKIFRSNKKIKAFDQFLEIHRQYRDFVKKSLEIPFESQAPVFNFEEFSGLDFVSLAHNQYQIEYLENHAEIKQDQLVGKEFRNETKDYLIIYISIHEYLVPPNCRFRLCDFSHWNITEKYDLIVMDPPWINASVNRSNSYSELDHYELFKIPIKKILSNSGTLIIWVTNNSKYHRFILNKLLPGYGLECTSKLVWIKVDYDGELITDLDNPHRKPYEIAYICQFHLHKKPMPEMMSITSIPTFHSRKPVLNMFEGEKKLELFSRSFNSDSIPIKGGGISPAFAKLPALQTLQLTDLGLTGAIPQLPQTLTGLLLSGNQLTGPIPDLSFYINNTQLGNPYLNLKNNLLGGVAIPPKLASIAWNDNVGCPFATNMCTNQTVVSCPGVTFTCQSDKKTAPTASNAPSATPATSDTILGLDKAAAYGIGGGIVAILVLIVVAAVLFVGRGKHTSPVVVKDGNVFAQNTHGNNQSQTPASQYSQPYQVQNQQYQPTPQTPSPVGYVMPNGQQYVVLGANSQLQTNNLCLNCGFNPKTHVVIPCGHEVFCTACAELNADGGVCNLCNQRFLVAQPANPSQVHQEPRIQAGQSEVSQPRVFASPSQVSDHPRFTQLESNEPRFTSPQADDNLPRFRY
ncbi:Methyltransferase-like protein 4 [Boothiomyces macroporosus]|uniref:Methyltransferase-like protein 4 n=1 Tax=Boothiomyces macroporosus TaxID=261099 RepID=A0AAD5UFP7_9FUNG|nr:Methyltransferase-like protein 4 [Boothiomyces macroporosus]